MSLLITLVADVLVAILLVATIVSSLRLSRRIAKLKADEASLRQTIGDLVTASATAERAIIGLRATLDECDRTLAERLGTAERYAADLSSHVEAGQAVIARISAIVSNAQPGRPMEAQHARTDAEREPAGIAVTRLARQPATSEPVASKPVASKPVASKPVMPVLAPVPANASPSPNGERIGVAAAAALAMSERALGRLRSRAA